MVVKHLREISSTLMDITAITNENPEIHKLWNLCQKKNNIVSKKTLPNCQHTYYTYTMLIRNIKTISLTSKQENNFDAIYKIKAIYKIITNLTFKFGYFAKLENHSENYMIIQMLEIV